MQGPITHGQQSSDLLGHAAHSQPSSPQAAPTPLRGRMKALQSTPARGTNWQGSCLPSCSDSGVQGRMRSSCLTCSDTQPMPGGGAELCTGSKGAEGNEERQGGLPETEPGLPQLWGEAGAALGTSQRVSVITVTLEWPPGCLCSPLPHLHFHHS